VARRATLSGTGAVHQPGQPGVFAQPGHRVRQRGLDRADRAVQNLRHLRLRQVVEDPQHQHGALPGGQRPQRTLHRDAHGRLGRQIPRRRLSGTVSAACSPHHRRRRQLDQLLTIARRT